MNGRTDSRRRLLALIAVFALAGSGLVVRLGYWQMTARDFLVDAAHRQIYVRTEVPSRRGQIYDRSGTFVLAGTVTRDKLIVSADGMDAAHQDAAATFLTAQLDLTGSDAAALRAKLAAGRSYIVVAKDLTPERTDAIRAAADAAGVGGLSVESSFARQYADGATPGSSIAAQLLGFVNGDGAGQYGIEGYYQDVLAGRPSQVESDRDANGDPIVDTEHVLDPGVPGSDLRLTIDAGLQLLVEQEVMAAQIADDAVGASAVVMDPNTGEILAEATYPSYDANDYAATASVDERRFIDPVVSDLYEPGSVFKILTSIAGLETGTTSLDKTYKDPGSLAVPGGRIFDSDHRNMHTLTLADGIAYSRNVVATQVAFGLAPTVADASTTLFDVWRRFGFGAPTGIDVSGEASGIVKDPALAAWRPMDLANASFGQGVAVTQIQLLAAYSAIANGGTIVTPHVVAAIDGHDVTPTTGATVISADVRATILQLLHHVVSSPWYVKTTSVPGYWLGGKTGTAQIWDPTTQAWRTDVYDYSFLGLIGRVADRPDLVIAVRIHEGRPKGLAVLPVRANELFRRVATDAVSIPGLLPELPADAQPATPVGG